VLVAITLNSVPIVLAEVCKTLHDARQRLEAAWQHVALAAMDLRGGAWVD